MKHKVQEADLRRAIFTWLVAFVFVIAASAFSIHYVDYSLAQLLLGSPHHAWIGKFFGGRALVAYETIIVSSLVLARLVKGVLPAFCKVVLIASAASIITYAINDLLLKPFFGRLPPGEANLAAINSVFHYFQGSDSSSFPSGHMALVGSFLAVVYRLYPSLRLIIVASLLLGSTVLVLGNWHFISDVVAGTFTGFTVGIIAGELWLRHTFDRAVN